ncbi:MAG: hypothetical protein V1720_15840 [bacterium]
MKNLLSFIVLLVVASFLISATANAQTYKGGNQSVETKASKSRGAGEDENIKSNVKVNSKDAADKFLPPYAKGGEKSRASNIKVIVENWTPYYVDIYNDGYYQGTIGPWDDSYFMDYGDAIELYGVATFDDGSTLTWGPHYVANDEYYTYTWKLSN